MRPFQLLVVLLVVCALFSIVSAGHRPHHFLKRRSTRRHDDEEAEDESPKPHQFDYAVSAGDTRFNQEQEADEDGNVVGEYTVLLPDGTTQRVVYRAHQVDGYFADVYIDGELVNKAGEEGSDDDDSDSDDSDSDSDDDDSDSEFSSDSDDDSDDDDDEDEDGGRIRKKKITSPSVVRGPRPGYVPVYAYRPIITSQPIGPQYKGGFFGGQLLFADRPGAYPTLTLRSRKSS